LSPEQDETRSQLNLPTFGRPGARRRRSGLKTLDQRARSGHFAIKWQATWEMSDKGRDRSPTPAIFDPHFALLEESWRTDSVKEQGIEGEPDDR